MTNKPTTGSEFSPQLEAIPYTAGAASACPLGHAEPIARVVFEEGLDPIRALGGRYRER
jgi:hypothetical protein